ncbi:hypothetical protein ZHAS_00012739 [Anopheles sinensis]|uniref:Uncharacterized protein n=1 Tax=Anopheles sinensis TaxID=74873 RepID=A0A084W3N4_ANOSI|nr:hypothetical protein ZHAS_00012739 [Anopheles sinensis]
MTAGIGRELCSVNTAPKRPKDRTASASDGKLTLNALRVKYGATKPATLIRR